MRIVSFTIPSDDLVRVGAVIDDTVADLSALTPPVSRGQGPSAARRLLDLQDLQRVERASTTAERHSLSAVRLAPPIPDPSKIVAAPVNYTDHQREMNESSCVDALGVFLKAPSSLLPDGGTVQLPYTDRRFDQEGELAAVIGRTVHGADEDQAAAAVFGYTCLLDMTMRGGEDRSTRKSFDTFTPLGPHIVTTDETGDPSGLRLRCAVNGTTRQDASIGDLIWSVPRLIAYASSVMTLHPGDIVTTGTPAGVGTVTTGDTIVVRIDPIGALTVRVAADHAVACPTRGAGRGPKPPQHITTLPAPAPGPEPTGEARPDA